MPAVTSLDVQYHRYSCAFISGRAVMAKLAAFGPVFLAYDPYMSAEQMAAASPPGVNVQHIATVGELCTKADVLSVHAPLSAATLGLIGAAELALMKPSAVRPTSFVRQQNLDSNDIQFHAHYNVMYALH